jgi:hypothetical protein
MSNGSTIIRCCVSSLLAVGLMSAAYAESANGAADVVAVGPLEIIEATTVTVLGRSFPVEDTTGLTTGDKVAVHGSLQADGSVTNAWAEPLGGYAAGSDGVFETGVVTDVNESLGRLSIGDSEIDYTSALSEAGATTPAKGDLVAVTGIQPEAGGVVLGSTTRAGTADVSMAVLGSGLAGLAGIIGSNAKSAGIIGSNLGTAGIIGSNAKSAGIIGSNLGRAGIIGSNAKSAGIIGSNLGTAGIIGSNAKSAGIIGSNLGTAGIIGSNAKSAGIIGSNLGTAGIIGSNAKSAGIIGSNAGTR